jgi:hypothetical protein
MASKLKHILNPTTEIPFSHSPCCHSQAALTSSNGWETMFASSVDPDVRQTCVPSPLRPMPEMQEPYPDQYDHRRNHILSSRSQVALSSPPPLQAPPRQYYQASREDYTHTHFEEPDAVSTTRFAAQSMGLAPVYLPACEPLEGGAVTPDYQITKTQFEDSATSQLENYLRVQRVPGQGVFHTYRDGSWIPAEVDGEVVHPVWGLTKAGKARKRLALACFNCRARKTRCEPAQKGCLQCEKRGRSCRWYVICFSRWTMSSNGSQGFGQFCDKPRSSNIY